MTSSGGIPPTNPYHVWRAYGTMPSQPARQTSQARQTERPAEISGAPIGASGQARAPTIARLVAGVVQGGVDFVEGQAVSRSGNLPFYRHPADRNAAATTIQIGRTLDVKG